MGYLNNGEMFLLHCTQLPVFVQIILAPPIPLDIALVIWGNAKIRCDQPKPQIIWGNARIHSDQPKPHIIWGQCQES